MPQGPHVNVRWNEHLSDLTDDERRLGPAPIDGGTGPDDRTTVYCRRCGATCGMVNGEMFEKTFEWIAVCPHVEMMMDY
jgi:hypothetical protein